MASRKRKPAASSRTELALHLALEAAAGLSFASFLLVHALLYSTRSELGTEVQYWGSAAALILFPLLLPLWPTRRRASSGGGLIRREGRRTTRNLLLSALPLIFLRAELPAHMLLAVLVVVTGHLLVRRRDDRAAAWILVLAPTAVLTAMAAAPGRAWLMALAVVVLVVTSGAVLLHARHTRAEVEARAPRVFVARWREGQPGRDSFGALVRRLWCVLPITAAALAGTAILYPLLASIPGPPYRSGNRTPAASGSDGAGEQRASQRRALEHIFPSELRPGGALSTLEFQQVMTIRARGETSSVLGEDLGAIYLRGICMGTFTESGLCLAADRTPELIRDHEDGRRNGWTVLDARPRTAMIRLDVVQQPMAVQGGSRQILFAPHPLHAVSAAAVWYDPDGMLQLPVDREWAELEYSLLVTFLDPRLLDLDARRARHSDARFLQLPRASADLDWIETQAERVVRGRANDAERLQAVLDYFRGSYRYSTRTGDVPGLEGIVTFMRRRKGHCTSFAAAAVLLLRTQGISTRVATGFLAKGFSPETGLYTVTTRNGHAWIEVWFDGVGWVSFDPTPARAREEAIAAAELGLDEGISAWFEELESDLRAWADSGADRVYLSILLATLAGAPAALWSTVKRSPGIALVMGLLLAATVWLRFRRWVSPDSAPYPRRRTPDETLIEKLLAALARSGHRRRPGQTLAEVASGVREDGDELARLVEELYGIRFGGAPLEADIVGRVEAWIERRRAVVVTSSSPVEIARTQ